MTLDTSSWQREMGSAIDSLVRLLREVPLEGRMEVQRTVWEVAAQRLEEAVRQYEIGGAPAITATSLIDAWREIRRPFGEFYAALDQQIRSEVEEAREGK